MDFPHAKSVDFGDFSCIKIQSPGVMKFGMVFVYYVYVGFFLRFLCICMEKRLESCS